MTQFASYGKAFYGADTYGGVQHADPPNVQRGITAAKTSAGTTKASMGNGETHAQR